MVCDMLAKTGEIAAALAQWPVNGSAGTDETRYEVSHLAYVGA